MSSLSSGSLAGRRILLGVCGSIAAYKAPMILRLLQDAGAELKVVMTESASHFIGEAVFRGLGVEVHQDMWAPGGEPHVKLAAWADALVIAPASADTMARLAQGRADDLLGATALCSQKPLIIAPAMHPSMWAHAATQTNAATLVERGAQLLGPVSGRVASGQTGMGRLMDPERIVALLARSFSSQEGEFHGRHFVITAGPTREAIDPVRALTNISSGKMGYALAAVALARGARVTLITGPVSLTPPEGAQVVQIESTKSLQQALDTALGEGLEKADALIMAAAVSDYSPIAPNQEKLKRGEAAMTLQLNPNPDLLAEIGKRRVSLRPVLVGFALETASGDSLIALGRKKLINKRADMIVANNASDSLGKDSNKVQLVSARDCRPLPTLDKMRVASEILDWLKQRLIAADSPEQTH